MIPILPKARLGVLVLVAIPCVASLWAGFFVDDYVLIEIAHDTPWGADLVASNFDIDATRLTDGWLPDSLASFRLRFFRPAVIALFKIDWVLYGLHPAGYHLTNLVLHLLMTYSIMVLVRPWVDGERQALLTGLLFGLMPHSFTAVVWLAGRTSLMASLMVVWCYLAFRRHVETGSRWAGAASVVALLVALASKETGLVAPLLIATCMPKRPWKRKLFWVLTALALLYLLGRATVWGWGTFQGLPTFGMPDDWAGRICFVWLKAAETFLSLALQLPHHHVFHTEAAKSAWLFGGISVLAVVVGFIVWRRLRREPAGRWILGWCVVSSLVTFPVAPMAHYLYLAQAGGALGMVLFWQARRGDPRWRVRLGVAAWALLLAIGATCYVGSSMLSRSQAAMVTGARERMARAAKDLRPGGTLALVDPHLLHIHLAPAFRLQTERSDVKIVWLNVSNTLLVPKPSELQHIDEHTVRLTAVGQPYLTDLVTWALLEGVEVAPLAEGMSVTWPDPPYRLTVAKLGPPTDAPVRGVERIDVRFADPIDGQHVALVWCIEPGDMDNAFFRWLLRRGDELKDRHRRRSTSAP
ncbi:MAG TPA: hypothetical protein VMZ31_04540 [Phycisphaerae bacterium]|nr:hypothetical protein [Phycisphaerae bacterium]